MMASPHTLVEGVIISVLRDPRQRTRSSTSAARCCTSSAGCSARSQEAYVAGYLGKDIHGSRLRPRAGRARRRRRLHLRRGDRAARLARGPPRPAAAAPAVPRGRRPLRQPDGDQQRRVDRVACRRIIDNGADWFASMGTEKSKGYGIYSLSGHVTKPGPVRGAAGHHAARAARPRRRHPRGPRAEVLDARRLVARRC